MMQSPLAWESVSFWLRRPRRRDMTADWDAREVNVLPKRPYSPLKSASIRSWKNSLRTPPSSIAGSPYWGGESRCGQHCTPPGRARAISSPIPVLSRRGQPTSKTTRRGFNRPDGVAEASAPSESSTKCDRRTRKIKKGEDASSTAGSAPPADPASRLLP
eukprot:scaffold266382_cov30-Tisochrysis_lutea.AAC.4